MTVAKRSTPSISVRRVLVGTLLALVALPVVFGAWLLTTQSGALLALDLARRTTGIALQVDGLTGRLIGPLSFERLSVDMPDLRVETGPVGIDWSPLSLIRGRVQIDSLTVETVSVAMRPTGPSEPEPLEMPNIQLPMYVQGELAVGSVVIVPWDEQDERSPLGFSGIRAGLSGESGVQRIDRFEITTPWGEAALSASFDTNPFPHALLAQGTVSAQVDGRDFRAAFDLDGDLGRLNARLNGEGAELIGSAEAVLTPFDAFPLHTLQLALDGLDPSAFAAGAPTATLGLNAQLATGSDGVLDGDVQVRNARPLRVDEDGLPVVALSTRVRASEEFVELEDLEVQLLGGGKLAGTLSAQLHETGQLPSVVAALAATAIDPSKLHAEAPQGSVQLDLNADFRDDDQLQLAWTFGKSRLYGMALAGKGRVRADGMHVPEADVDVSLGPSRLTARGAWGKAGDALNLALVARRIEQLRLGISGNADVKATLRGTPDAPAGQFTARAESLRLQDGVGAQRITAEGSLATGIGDPLKLVVEVIGVGDRESRWVEQARAQLAGSRLAHTFTLDAATPEGDRLQVGLEGGQPKDGALAWRGELQRFQLDGRLPLRLEAPVALTASPQRAALAAARFVAGKEGRVVLDETIWSPERIRAVGHLTGLAIIEEVSGAPSRWADPLTLGAEWEIELTNQAEGQLRVYRESGDITIPGEFSTRIGLQHLEAVVVASGERLAASLDASGTEMGTLSGSATALLERDADSGWRLAPNGDLLGSVQFDMPSISWLSRLMQQETVLDGALSAQFSVVGTPAEPQASGRITGEGLSMTLVEHGAQLSGGELLAEFDRDRLYLRRLEFVSANRVRPPDRRVPFEALTREPGRLTASGEVALDSGEGRFSFEADRLPILQRTDRWLLMSGSGSAVSTWTSLSLEAFFRADAGYIEFSESPPPSLSEDVVILGTEEPAGEGLQVSAAVTVSLGDALYLSALGLDTRLAGDLQLRLQPGDPLSATGTISTEGGVYRGYGQSLSIDRGVINFQGALDNPGLNVVALRKGLAVEAGVAVTGSARRPVVRLVSEPEVPDPDKLSWIVLGRGPTAGGGADLSLLLPAAQALLGGPGGGMTEQLQRSLGLDEFGIGQSTSGIGRVQTSRVVGSGTTVTGESDLSGQVLTLGRRVGEDLNVSFEQSLSGAESLVFLTYQLTRRIAVVARGGSDNAADVYYTITFR